MSGSSMSLVFLVLANLLPLAGVFFLGWSAEEIVLVYWLENVAVGMVNLLKILTNRHEGSVLPGKLFLGVFFSVHYGIFTLVHGMFVFSMFKMGEGMMMGIGEMIRAAMAEQGWVFASFLVSHLVSFVQNYHLKGEAMRLNLGQVMFLPYPRIFVLHLTIIFGGMAVVALGSPMFLVAVLVVLKIVGDVFFHQREHQKAQGGGTR